jgi:hypothetical protein
MTSVKWYIIHHRIFHRCRVHEALSHYEKEARILENTPENSVGLMTVYNSLGSVFHTLGK